MQLREKVAVFVRLENPQDYAKKTYAKCWINAFIGQGEMENIFKYLQ